jgi:hypothetical protein
VEGLSLLRQLGIAAVDLEPWRPTVADVTVIGDETTHGSDLRGSRLSVLETIAPSETVLDPIPEDDDPDVGHWGWRPEIETARRTGNPLWALCGKLVYIPARRPPKHCQVCVAIARESRGRRGRD